VARAKAVWENRKMHIEKFWQELLANPRKTIFSLISLAVVELLKHKICSWILEKIDSAGTTLGNTATIPAAQEGVIHHGAVVTFIRYFCQGVLDHPVTSFLSAIGVYALIMVFVVSASLGRKAWLGMVRKRTEANAAREQRIADMESRLNAITVNAANDDRISTLEHWVGHKEPHAGLWRELNTVRDELHGDYISFLLDITQLMAEATALSARLMDIGTLYPDSIQVRAPFSQDWVKIRATVGGELTAKWAMAVKHHLGHCRIFARAVGLPENLLVDPALSNQLWNSQEPLGQCLNWLLLHWEHIKAAREMKKSDEPMPQFAAHVPPMSRPPG
jgi:hypothetical protein